MSEPDDDPHYKQTKSILKGEALFREQKNEIELNKAKHEADAAEVQGEMARLCYALQLLTMTANLRGSNFEGQRRVAELFVVHSTERVLGI